VVCGSKGEVVLWYVFVFVCGGWFVLVFVYVVFVFALTFWVESGIRGGSERDG
jgi:hypothetical protein